MIFNIIAAFVLGAAIFYAGLWLGRFQYARHRAEAARWKKISQGWEDAHAQMRIRWEIAHALLTRRAYMCERCEGYGFMRSEDGNQCQYCKGKGWLSPENQEGGTSADDQPAGTER